MNHVKGSPLKRAALLPAMALALLISPAAAAPQADFLIDQFEGFRAVSAHLNTAWTLDMGAAHLPLRLEGKASAPQLAFATSAPELDFEGDPSLYPLIACYLACSDLTTRLETLGFSFSSDTLVQLQLGTDDDSLTYRIGAPEHIELQLDREVYTPRAMLWRSSQGVGFEIRSSRFSSDGWRERQLSVTADGLLIFTLTRHDES